MVGQSFLTNPMVYDPPAFVARNRRFASLPVVFLTAAHCAHPLSVGDMTVRVGNTVAGTGGELRRVTQILRPPEHGANGLVRGHSGVSVALPKEMRNPEEDPAIIKESSVVVAVTADGKLFLGKKPIEMAELKTEVDAKMSSKERDQRIVYVRSDINTNYGTVVNVINNIRDAGFPGGVYGISRRLTECSTP